MNETPPFAGKTALVTGAGSGTGEATAVLLARRGAASGSRDDRQCGDHWGVADSASRPKTRREALRFWLDIATVMMAAVTFGCYFTAISATGTVTGSGELLTIATGPASFLVGVFGAIKVLMSPAPPFTLAACTLGLLGVAIQGVVRGVRPTLGEHHRIEWQLGCTVVAAALLTTAAQVQLRAQRPEPFAASQSRRYGTLPYYAIFATYLLVLWVLIDTGLTPAAWIAVGGAVGSTILVVCRQITAFTDNARLLADLNETVAELQTAVRDRDRLAEKLRYQAFHDPLTGLANRALFAERLTQTAGSDGRLIVRASVGVAGWDTTQGADTTLHEADVAMYTAKGRGGGTYAVA